jgi:glycosyltransferase involved in cell wall biosynthesis
VRIGFDVSALAQTRAGPARYVVGLLHEFERMVDIDVERFAFGDARRAATLARELVWYPLSLPREASRKAVDVIHCPTYRGPLRSKAPLVVTVHDIAVFRHPSAFPPWTRTYSRRAVPHVLRAAERIVAVSEFTAHELVEVLGIPETKIRVIPNGVGEVFQPDGNAAPGEYALAVGTLEPRKNLDRVIAATGRLGIELVIVGARGWGDVRVDRPGVRWLGEVSDLELAELYRGALCLVFASLYEGFGIPILEGMACGTPVVTSKGGATEEVAGGAAILVDPFDPTMIALGIAVALRRQEELRRLGLARAAEFPWSKAALATADVYREVAA